MSMIMLSDEQIAKILHAIYRHNVTNYELIKNIRIN